MAAASGGTPPRKHRLFVAAIDFGTTYSGYAFSSKDDYEKEPQKVNSNVWNAGTKSLLSSKAPTTLLLNPDKTFNSFGYDAESLYSELAEDDEDFQDYYYFHCFKMLLHNNKKLRRDTEIVDATGKSLEAMIVFSLSIKFLKEHLFNSLSDKFAHILPEDIHYVLTVPAIWDDNAKQFMREAAVKAGIDKDQLSIALEPEVASIYCQNLPLERQKADGASFLNVAKSGTKYMVVDLGGGTTDITVHRRSSEGKLQEIHCASGGPWGGRNVNESFFSFLKDIFGENVVKIFKVQHMDDYLELCREFETKKRAVTTNSKSGRVSMTLPLSVFELAKKENEKESLDEILKETKYGGQVNAKNQKLQIAIDIFKSFFTPTLEGITNHIQNVLRNKCVCDVEHILMVGGFSECEIVQKHIKSALKDKRIIVPDETGLAVLKGAVLYGHMPRVITLRVARHTYGIQSWPEFDSSIHPLAKRVIIDGVPRCKDVFYKYVTVGEQISPGYQFSQTFQALKPQEDTLECTIHASTEENPRFITDASCFRLGTLTVPLPKVRSSAPLEIEETMVFGETELHVKAKDLTHNRTYDAFFNFLDN